MLEVSECSLSLISREAHLETLEEVECRMPALHGLKSANLMRLARMGRRLDGFGKMDWHIAIAQCQVIPSSQRDGKLQGKRQGGKEKRTGNSGIYALPLRTCPKITC